MSLPGLQRSSWCRALISVGTPHRGAPKALQWTVSGAPLGLPGPTRLVREWPSVAELLPRYPVVRDTRVLDETSPVAALYPHELDLPGLGQRARDAFYLHESIRTAWDGLPRSGPTMRACLGWPHPTLSAAYWDGSRLRLDKQLPWWLPAKGWEKDVGDGTVPGPAAVPLEQDDDADGPRRLPDRHIALASSQVVVDLLGEYLRLGSLRKYRNPAADRHPPSLGMDLEEVHSAGMVIPIAVVPAKRIPISAANQSWRA